MADTLTFSRSIRVNGLLADADSSPLLTDSAATYGVKRLDTGAVVISAETFAAGITHDGTGLYSYTLTNPISGVQYQAAFKTVVGGRTLYSFRALEFSAGHYGSRAGIEDIYGVVNVFEYANIDSDGNTTTIANRIDRAETSAKTWINEAFANARPSITPPTVGQPYYSSLTDIENEYAGVLLYQSRGMRDGVADADGVMKDHEQRAKDRLAAIIKRLTNAGTFTFLDQVQTACAADEYGGMCCNG